MASQQQLQQQFVRQEELLTDRGVGRTAWNVVATAWKHKKKGQREQLSDYRTKKSTSLLFDFCLLVFFVFLFFLVCFFCFFCFFFWVSLVCCFGSFSTLTSTHTQQTSYFVGSEGEKERTSLVYLQVDPPPLPPFLNWGHLKLISYRVKQPALLLCYLLLAFCSFIFWYFLFCFVFKLFSPTKPSPALLQLNCADSTFFCCVRIELHTPYCLFVRACVSFVLWLLLPELLVTFCLVVVLSWLASFQRLVSSLPSQNAGTRIPHKTHEKLQANPLHTLKYWCSALLRIACVRQGSLRKVFY